MQALFDRVRADREQGFSIVDEELERGLRSIAVPVLDRTGQAVGAINLSTHATRTTRNEMREQFLPELRRIAQRISQARLRPSALSEAPACAALVTARRKPYRLGSLSAQVRISNKPCGTPCGRIHGRS